MAFEVHDKDGTPTSGDAVLSQIMKDDADAREGYIIDTTTGQVIYGARLTIEEKD